MHSIKRIAAVLLCTVLLLGMAGCESAELKEAKECIDAICEAAQLQAEMEVKLRSYSNASSNSDQAMRNHFENQIFYCERLIEVNIDKLKDLYRELSEEEQQALKEYAQETLEDNLADIWN